GNRRRRLVCDVHFAVAVPCVRIVTATTRPKAQRYLLARIGAETHIDPFTGSRARGRAAPRQPGVLSLAIESSAEEEVPVIKERNVRGEIQAIAQKLSPIIPLPPLRNPDIAVSCVLVRVRFSPQYDAVSAAYIAAGLKTEVVRLESRTHAPHCRV